MKFLNAFSRLLLLSVLGLLLCQKSFAQTLRVLKTDVKEVTLFLNRAQVTSTARTTVEAGSTTLAFTNLPATIDQQSLQVDVKGNATLFGVQYQPNYLNQQGKSREQVAVEDSLESYRQQLRTATDHRDVYTKEEAMLLSNQSIGGANKGVDVDELADMADFFRDRLMSIRSNIQKTDIRIKRLNEAVQRFQNQLNQMGGGQGLPTGQVEVTVSAPARTTLELEISYVVSNAGWSPVYDLRATDTKSPIRLHYKANVYQNTGVNWQNVKLKLSTANPTVGAAKPELYPWYLGFYTPQPVSGAYYEMQAAPISYDESERKELSIKGNRSAGVAHTVSGAKAPARSLSQDIEVSQTDLAVEFNITVPYSIPSDGKPHLVDVQQHELKANYKHSTVPKLDKDAFLMAEITSWEDYNLLPGQANVFFEGTFTGKTFINARNTNDTLALSLGRDKKIVVTREKKKDFKSKGFLGSNIKETSGYEITIRNTKNQPVELTVEDQIPLSRHNQIEVETMDLDGGKLDKETGKVTWQVRLNPNETKKLQLKFSVKYPKNQQISGL